MGTGAGQRLSGADPATEESEREGRIEADE